MFLGRGRPLLTYPSAILALIHVPFVLFFVFGPLAALTDVAFCLFGLLRRSWAVLGASWGDLGAVLAWSRGLGAVLEQSWGRPGGLLVAETSQERG